MFTGKITDYPTMSVGIQYLLLAQIQLEDFEWKHLNEMRLHVFECVVPAVPSEAKLQFKEKLWPCSRTTLPISNIIRSFPFGEEILIAKICHCVAVFVLIFLLHRHYLIAVSSEV